MLPEQGMLYQRRSLHVRKTGNYCSPTIALDHSAFPTIKTTNASLTTAGLHSFEYSYISNSETANCVVSELFYLLGSLHKPPSMPLSVCLSTTLCLSPSMSLNMFQMRPLVTNSASESSRNFSIVDVILRTSMKVFGVSWPKEQSPGLWDPNYKHRAYTTVVTV